MGNMPGSANTALAGDLYAALLWQLLFLVALTAVVSVLLARRRPTTSRAATAAEPRGRRILRLSLGVLWIVDGLLQAQPAMPGSLVQQTITPALESAPDWLYSLVDPFTRVFLQHPVAADAMTVWIQVGLGIAILVGGAGRLARLALVASVVWAAFVWVVGEVLGGLTDPTASWLTGAPGAASLYVVAAALLLLPWSSWETGKAPRLARGAVGLTLLAGAVLQALPRAGYWSPTGLFNVFSDVAMSGVPAPAAAPVQWLATAIPAHADLANAILVATLGILGVGLLVDAFRRQISVAAGVLCLLGWWFGQGFGVFGGAATDPNTSVVLILLLVAGWPRSVASEAVPEETASVPIEAADRPDSRWPVAAGVLAVACVLVLPVVAGVGLLGSQTAQAAVGDSGGLVETAPSPAPDFTLTDQGGRSVSMRDQRGKLTVVVFLDPECFDSCPLVANQLATAVRSLGDQSASVAIVAVDVNPVFNTVQDVRTFTDEHGLADLPGWHFVTGTTGQVGAVLAAFGEGVTVPRVGMIGHPQNVYLFGRSGAELSVLNDTANDNLTQSYVQLITAELRRRL